VWGWSKLSAYQQENNAIAFLLYTPTQYGDYSISFSASAITSTAKVTKSLSIAHEDYSPPDAASKDLNCNDLSNF